MERVKKIKNENCDAYVDADGIKRKKCRTCAHVASYIGEDYNHWYRHTPEYCAKNRANAKIEIAGKTEIGYEDYVDLAHVKRRRCLFCKGKIIRKKIYVGETIVNWYKHKEVCLKTPRDPLAALPRPTFGLKCGTCLFKTPITKRDIEKSRNHWKADQIGGGCFDCKNCPRNRPRTILRTKEELAWYEEELSNEEQRILSPDSIAFRETVKMRCFDCDTRQFDSMPKISANAAQKYEHDHYEHRCDGFKYCAKHVCLSCGEKNIILRENAVKYGQCTEENIEALRKTQGWYDNDVFVLNCIKCDELMILLDSDLIFNKKISEDVLLDEVEYR